MLPFKSQKLFEKIAELQKSHLAVEAGRSRSKQVKQIHTAVVKFDKVQCFTLKFNIQYFETLKYWAFAAICWPGGVGHIHYGGTSDNCSVRSHICESGEQVSQAEIKHKSMKSVSVCVVI